MKNILLYAAVAVLAGCSPYGALLKGEDHQAQYAAAKAYMDAGKYSKARALLERVMTPYFNTPQSDSILFMQALSFYKQGDYVNSEQGFDMFRTNHQRSPMLEQAEYLYAMGHYLSSPDPDRDQGPTMSAIDAINIYVSRYPDSEYRQDLEEKRRELTQKLHDKSFINARSYHKVGQYKPAVVALRNALKEYPETKHREEILYLIVMSSYQYASNSVLQLRHERYLDVMERYMDYKSEYPQGEHFDELTKLYDRARKYVAGEEVTEEDGKGKKEDKKEEKKTE